MITMVVNIRVKQEAVDAWMAETLENAEASRMEPGILSFDLHQNRDDPTRFIIIEEYMDEDAMARHKATAHYARWNKVTEPLQAEPRTRDFWHKIEVPFGI